MHELTKRLLRGQDTMIHICESYGIPYVTFKMRKKSRSCYYVGQNTICFARHDFEDTESRFSDVMLHELAHHVTYSMKDLDADGNIETGHGQAFWQRLHELTQKLYQNVHCYAWADEYSSGQAWFLKRYGLLALGAKESYMDRYPSWDFGFRK